MKKLIIPFLFFIFIVIGFTISKGITPEILPNKNAVSINQQPVSTFGWYLIDYACPGVYESVACCCCLPGQNGNSYVCDVPTIKFTCSPGGFNDCTSDLGVCMAVDCNPYCCPIYTDGGGGGGNDQWGLFTKLMP